MALIGAGNGAAQTERPAPLRLDTLPALLDRIVPDQLRRHRIPGAVISVVANGRTIFSRGYGFADMERRIPATPDTTMVRPGSVTKLFTWTAVMQLVEQGKLDLRTDVNRYLKRLRIPATYSEPITLAHLLTHTAGFEDRWIGLFVRGPDDLVPLADYIVRALPQRVRPPGELAVYSNYSALLAGYIVEQVADTRYEKYVEDRIFRPLGMTNTTFQQPPSRPGMTTSVSYIARNGGFKPKAFEYVQAVPAGGMSTTADDMARFIAAHLPAPGVRSPLLDERALRLMHEQQFTHHRRFPGLTYGFVERPGRGPRVIWHPGGGGAMAFLSVLALVPEDGIGIFASYNSAGGAAAREELLDALLDLLHPDRARVPEPLPPASDAERAATELDQIAGTYRTGLYARSTIEKLTALAQVTVKIGPDRTLTIRGSLPSASSWVPEGERLFRKIDGDDLVAFLPSRNGRIRYLAWSAAPVAGFEKVAWYESVAFHALVLLFCAAMFLSAAITWPVGALVRRARGAVREGSRSARVARLIGAGTSALNLIVLGTVLVLILGRTEQSLAYGVSPLLIAVLVLALVTAMASVLVAVYAMRAWTSKFWTPIGRLHYAGVAVATLAFAWWLYYWNLLGFWF